MVNNDLTMIQQIVGDWSRRVFPASTPDSKIAHLRREVEELAEDHAPEEAADCLILLLGHADLCGYDLASELFRKMEINRDREWNNPDHEGVQTHVKESE